MSPKGPEGWAPRVIEGGVKQQSEAVRSFLTDAEAVFIKLPFSLDDYSREKLEDIGTETEESLIMQGREILKAIEEDNVTSEQLQHLRLLYDGIKIKSQSRTQS